MNLDKKVLIIGAEGTGKHDISKKLVENKIRASLDLDVLTCIGLPLPGDRDLHQTGIQFICFVMSTASKESMKILMDSISQVDVAFFAGRSVIVANQKDTSTDKGVTAAEIRGVADKYGIPVLFTTTEIEDELQGLGDKLMSMIESVISWKRHVSPLLYETTRVTDTLTDTMMCQTPVTPAT